MRKKITVLTLCAMFFALSLLAEAQQPKKVPRIGFLSGSGDPWPRGPLSGLRQGLQDLGYFEDKNFVIEFRSAEAKLDRIPSLVAELVQLKVDVLVVTTAGVRAAKEATKTIPIVMVVNVDPVATGLIDSLSRPGGNITGLTTLTYELGGKRLELLTELVPAIARVGVLWDADSRLAANAIKEYEVAGRALGLQVQSLKVRGPNPNLEGAFQEAAKGRAMLSSQ